MNKIRSNTSSNVTWFVGSSYGGTDDQSPRFLSEGIWENGHDHKHLDLVKSMRPGERIALKSSYTRKNSLPFDNRGTAVSVIGIKAIGEITENLNDGKKVKVDWIKFDSVRKWYFYTHRSTIWRVEPGKWTNDALIAFAFEGAPQDFDLFRNDLFWQQRYGTKSAEPELFQWTAFYEAVAEKLLAYANNREPLIAGIHEIGKHVPKFQILQDKFPDGSSGPLQDICPFTAMGIFNRNMTDDNRKLIAEKFAEFLDIAILEPTSFKGVPLVNNQRSWFFGFADKRKNNDIDTLWKAPHQSLTRNHCPTAFSLWSTYRPSVALWGLANPWRRREYSNSTLR